MHWDLNIWIILISAILITGWEQNCKWNKSSAHSCSQLPLYLTIQTTNSYSTSINIWRTCTWEFQIPKKLVGALLWAEAINWTQKLHSSVTLCRDIFRYILFAIGLFIWMSISCLGKTRMDRNIHNRRIEVPWRYQWHQFYQQWD